MDVIEEFIQATDRCTEQICSMQPLEKEKQKALISWNVNQMEQMVNDQQAAIMQLDNLEKQRIHAQCQAGFSGLSANEILKRAPQPVHDRLAASFQALREAAQKLKLYNKKANEFAKASLQFLQTVSGKRVQPATRTTYSTNGAQNNGWNRGSSLKIRI